MKVDNFRFKLGNKEYVPIMIGGMGVNISTAELALEAARLGGIGHISDAEIGVVADQRFGTDFVKRKYERYRDNADNHDKSKEQFDLGEVAEAQRLHIGKTMEAKRGDGAIFLNCMEKLQMNNPFETLRVRLEAAMDAGIDGITLSAGLHMRSFELIKDHPRFRDVKFGIIVSSVRALKIFLHRAVRLGRIPDFVVVEGPLAGGHLGFDIHDLDKYTLEGITLEVIEFLKKESVDIPVIAAGGIFTGTDGVKFLEMGAAAIQVATRFTIARESGFSDTVRQAYITCEEEDVVVNMVSPTGYPMRMLKQSPALQASFRPNCEALGYILDAEGHCSYITSYEQAVQEMGDKKGKIVVNDKFCLCTSMKTYSCWTCGSTVYRLKETTRRLPDGSYQIPTAEDIFVDYQFSEDNQIRMPAKMPLQVATKV
ncbi:MAG: nitronate monooxygenase [Chlorobiales bacterium]|nr:nitronate monooxygenase [Chlorobiales bacterium]